MTPTLLEGLVALILIGVAWRIGTEIAPTIFRALRRVIHQVDQVDQEVTTLDQTAIEKEEKNANSQSE